MAMSTDEERLLPGWAEAERYWPGFSLSRLGRIQGILVRREDSNETVAVEMSASHRDDPSGPLVVVRLTRVSGGKLPELDRLWLAELSIEDLSSNQLEGIRYRVYDEAVGVHIYCSAIEIQVISRE